MTVEQLKNRIKVLWQRERQTLESKDYRVDKTWHRGYQAALEDILLELGDDDGTL